MKIDAHQHFWQLTRSDYGWLTPDLAELYQDFGPEDLTPVLGECGIEGTVLVQAAPTLAETEFLLDIAKHNRFIKGVVGWVDFQSPDAADRIKLLAKNPLLVGLRPMIQDIEDDDWMLKAELAPAFEALIETDLSFDALVYPRHLENLIALLERYPTMRSIIDHGAKPQIGAKAFERWAELMAQLAQNTSAFCKLSGLVTEAGEHWQPEDLFPYIDYLVKQFGHARLIWGSDWPVATLACDYTTWFELAYARVLGANEKQSIFGANAVIAYKLDRTGRLDSTLG